MPTCWRFHRVVLRRALGPALVLLPWAANAQLSGDDLRHSQAENAWRQAWYAVLDQGAESRAETRNRLYDWSPDTLELQLVVTDRTEGRMDRRSGSVRETREFSAHRGPYRLRLPLTRVGRATGMRGRILEELSLWRSVTALTRQYLQAAPMLARFPAGPPMARQRAQVEWDMERAGEWTELAEFADTLAPRIEALERVLLGLYAYRYPMDAPPQDPYYRVPSGTPTAPPPQPVTATFGGGEFDLRQETTSNGERERLIEERSALSSITLDEVTGGAWDPAVNAVALAWTVSEEDWRLAASLWDAAETLNTRFDPARYQPDRRDYAYRPPARYFLETLVRGLTLFGCAAREFTPGTSQRETWEPSPETPACPVHQNAMALQLPEQPVPAEPPMPLPAVRVSVDFADGLPRWPYEAASGPDVTIEGTRVSVNRRGERSESPSTNFVDRYFLFDTSADRRLDVRATSGEAWAGTRPNDENSLRALHLAARLEGTKAQGQVEINQRSTSTGDGREEAEQRATELAWTATVELPGVDLPEPEPPRPAAILVQAVTAPNPVQVGREMALGLRVTNTGSEPWSGAPLQLRAVDANTLSAWPLSAMPAGCRAAGALVGCSLPSLPAGESVDLVFRGRAPAVAGPLWWQATAGAFRGNGLADIAEPALELYGVIPIQDQTHTEYGVPSYPYPFQEGRPERATGRRLLLVGRGLPREGDERPEFTSSDPALRYRLADWPDTDSPLWQPLYAEARERVESLLGSQAGDVDVLLVEVFLSRGVLPGLKRFTINGQPATWRLRFGQLGGRLGFARDAPGETLEPVDTAYVPEIVRPWLSLSTPLPVESIAAEIVIDAPGQSERRAVVLTRSERHGPGVYLGPPISLRTPRAPAEMGTEDVALPGNVLDVTRVRLEVPEPEREDHLLLPLEPHPAPLSLALTPGSWLFKDALRRVAVCRGTDIQGWDTLSASEAERISNLMIFTRGDHWVGEPVSYGHMAAMVLLRDAFLEELALQRQRLAQIAANPLALRGFIAYLRARALDDSLPLLRMPVQDIDGGDTELRYLLFETPEEIARRTGRSVEAIHRWLESQAAAAIARLDEASAESAAQAREAGECDAEALLAITGAGFDVIRQVVEPRLMRLAELGGAAPRLRWVPDELGRASLAGIAPLAERVRRQQADAAVDTDLALFALSVVALPFILAENATVVMIGFALDAAGFVGTATHEFAMKHRSDRELAFAAGASIVIGDARYQQAEAQAKTWVSTAFNVGTAAAGALGSALDAVPAAVAAGRVARGERMVAQAASQGIRSLRQAELVDFLFFATNARAQSLVDGADALTDLQRQAIRVVDAVAGGAEPLEAAGEARHLSAVELDPVPGADTLVLREVTAPDIAARAGPAEPDFAAMIAESRARLETLGMSEGSADINAEILVRQLERADDAVIVGAWQHGFPPEKLFEAGFTEEAIREALARYTVFRKVDDARAQAIVDDYLGGETLALRPARSADEAPMVNDPPPAPGDYPGLVTDPDATGAFEPLDNAARRRDIAARLRDLGLGDNNADVASWILEPQLYNADHAVVVGAWQHDLSAEHLLAAGYTPEQIRDALQTYGVFRETRPGLMDEVIEAFLGGETVSQRARRLAAGDLTGDTLPPPARDPFRDAVTEPLTRVDGRTPDDAFRDAPTEPYTVVTEAPSLDPEATLPPPSRPAPVVDADPNATAPPPPRADPSLGVDANATLPPSGAAVDAETAIIPAPGPAMATQDAERLAALYALREEYLRGLAAQRPGAQNGLREVDRIRRVLDEANPASRSAALRLAGTLQEYGFTPLNAWRVAALKSARSGDPIVLHAELLAEQIVFYRDAISISKFMEQTDLPYAAARSKLEEAARLAGKKTAIDGDTLSVIR